MILIYILISFIMGIIFANYAYSKRLIEKAKAPKEYGGSNIIFVKGQPLAIMFEKDYIKSGMFLHRGGGE